jgi:hypothetical protein
MGSHGQEGMTAVPRAEDGYGQAENRLPGYDRELLGWGATHLYFPFHRPYWHFLDLCYTLTASIDILRDLFEPFYGPYTLSRPLQHYYSFFGHFYDRYGHSHGLYYHSIGLYWPFHGLCCTHTASIVTKGPCKHSYGLCNNLKASSGTFLGYTSPLTAFIANLMASTCTFMASTILTRPPLIFKGPCKHSHGLCNHLKASSGTLTVYTVQALSLPLQAFLCISHALSRPLQTLLTAFISNLFGSKIPIMTSKSTHNLHNTRMTSTVSCSDF